MRKTSDNDPVVDVDAQGRRLALGAKRVRTLASLVLRRERVPHALLSIAFVSREHIARLNREHLGHRGATDVITFALGRPGPRTPLVGDIYIAPEVVRGQARRHGVPAREESCLPCDGGKALQDIIAADKAHAQEPNCAFAGCSMPVRYTYCDTPSTSP